MVIILLGLVIAVGRKEPLLNPRQFDLLPVGLALGLSAMWCVALAFMWGPVGLLIGLVVGLLGWWSLTALFALLRELSKGSTKPIVRSITPKYQGRITTLANHFLYHKYRSWYFWWRGQPEVAAVEIALRQACAVRPEVQKRWLEPLRRLEARQQQPDSPDKLIADLESDDWVARFTARYALVALGGEAIAFLQPLADDEANFSRQLAIRLLRNIGLETSASLAKKAPSLLCPRCLVRGHAHRVPLSWQPDFTFYGCRACRQSRELIAWPGRVIVVLDTEWGEEQSRQDDVWRANWLQRRSLFDFDEVEIVQASDEDVERFAMQVGNDTDPVRDARYLQMRCFIASQCRLSENTLRILRHTFGQVERLGEPRQRHANKGQV